MTIWRSRRLALITPAAAMLATAPAFGHQIVPTASAKAPPANTVSGVTVTAPEKPNSLVDPARGSLSASTCRKGSPIRSRAFGTISASR